MERQAETRKSVFERHPKATLGLFVLVVVALLDLGSTAIYKVFRPQFYRPQSVFRVQDDVYHHGFKPMTSVDLEYWGPLAASYRINSLGFRDKAVREVPLASDRRRIVFIGDSFTEGIGVPYEKTFVGLIDETLASRGIEVLNAGAASYTPIIYYRRVRHLLEDVGLRFDELFVCIDIGDIQDEVTYKLDEGDNVVFRQQRWALETDANWRFGKPRFLTSARLHGLLRKHTLVASTLYEATLAALSSGPRRAAAWTLDPQVFEEYGREGVPRAEANMGRLADLLARHRVRLTVVVYPWPDQILARDAESRQVRVWREWAKAHGAGFIDAFPAFLAGEPEEIVRREFIRGDIHWNERGHRRIADAVLHSAGDTRP
jgi:lysophospholipase L1-like esterase